jgi:hypothetical protein
LAATLKSRMVKHSNPPATRYVIQCAHGQSSKTTTVSRDLRMATAVVVLQLAARHEAVQECTCTRDIRKMYGLEN